MCTKCGAQYLYQHNKCAIKRTLRSKLTDDIIEIYKADIEEYQQNNSEPRPIDRNTA